MMIALPAVRMEEIYQSTDLPTFPVVVIGWTLTNPRVTKEKMIILYTKKENATCPLRGKGKRKMIIPYAKKENPICSLRGKGKMKIHGRGNMENPLKSDTQNGTY